MAKEIIPTPECVLRSCAHSLGYLIRRQIDAAEAWLTLGPHGLDKRKWDAAEIEFIDTLVDVRYFTPPELLPDICEIIGIRGSRELKACKAFLLDEATPVLFRHLNKWAVTASKAASENRLVLQRLRETDRPDYSVVELCTPAPKWDCNNAYERIEVRMSLKDYTKLVKLVSSPMRRDKNHKLDTDAIDEQFFSNNNKGE